MSSLYVVKHEHKTRVKGTYERVTEGADQTGSGTLLSRIYTVVYITDKLSEECTSDPVMKMMRMKQSSQSVSFVVMKMTVVMRIAT
ncbi:hypothetical protein FQN60_002454, partial [Etheostoma spectabile]